MQTNKQDILFLLIIFYTMIAHGAYFPIGLIVLNLYFVASLLNGKKITLMCAAFFALFLLMCASAVFVSPSKYAALCGLLKYLLLFSSYASFIQTQEKSRFEKVFYYSFVFLALAGLFSYAGVIEMTDMVTLKGQRLQSFLQYANTTAFFMGTGILFSLDYFIKTKQIRYIFLCAVFLSALILTKSRTVFILFIPVTAVYISTYMKKNWILAFISFIAVLSAMLVFFGSRTIRISLFEPTFIERIITYADAMNIIVKNPFGIGVGAWQYAQLELQSAPYYVSRIHNYYLELALDGGIISLVLFACICVATLISIAKSRKKLYSCTILFLLAHSFFDVNMNYGICIVLFTFLLSEITNEKLYAFSFKMKIPLIAMLLPLAVLLVSEYCFYRGKLENGMGYYNITKTLNPLNDSVYYFMALAQTDVDESIKHLNYGIERAPYDENFISALSDAYAFKGEYKIAYSYALQAIEAHKFNPENQMKALNILQAALQSRVITSEEYEVKRKSLLNRIEEINASIHPFYRYIDADMRY